MIKKRKRDGGRGWRRRKIRSTKIKGEKRRRRCMRMRKKNRQLFLKRDASLYASSTTTHGQNMR